MEFYEFMTEMYACLNPNKKNKSDFMGAFFSTAIDPSLIQGKNEEENEDLIYPFTKKSARTNNYKYYRPKGKLSAQMASQLASCINGAGIEDLVYKAPFDTQAVLKNFLLKYGYVLKEDELPTAVVEIYTAFLEAAENKKDEIDDNLVFEKIKKALNPEITPITDRVPIKDSVCMDGCIMLESGQKIKLPAPLTTPQRISPKERPYTEALMEAYTEQAGTPITPDNINKHPRYNRHFNNQRDAFYSAESLRHSVRDVFVDGDSEFKKLEDDAYEGIEPTYEMNYKNGFSRLNAVLEKVTNTTLVASRISSISNLYGNREKKGICHMLVNDNYIKSWVNIDD